MNEPCDSCVLRDLCRHRGPHGRATSQAAGNLDLSPQCTDRGGRVVALRSGQATVLPTRLWMRQRIAVESITKVTTGGASGNARNKQPCRRRQLGAL